MTTYSKYGNHRVTVDNIRFDSKAEARRYEELKLLVYAGDIADLQVHPAFVLQDKYRWRDETGRWHTERAITYEADFSYVENGRLVAEDVKGAQTDVFRLKARLFRKLYPDVVLRLIRA